MVPFPIVSIFAPCVTFKASNNSSRVSNTCLSSETRANDTFVGSVSQVTVRPKCNKKNWYGAKRDFAATIDFESLRIESTNYRKLQQFFLKLIAINTHIFQSTFSSCCTFAVNIQKLSDISFVADIPSVFSVTNAGEISIRHSIASLFRS